MKEPSFEEALSRLEEIVQADAGTITILGTDIRYPLEVASSLGSGAESNCRDGLDDDALRQLHRGEL